MDLVRAFEGILLGFVLILVAALLTGGTYGMLDFAAVLVIPAVLMLVFMHQGVRPRRLYAIRALAALLGWALIWIVFIPVYLFLSYAVIPGSEQVLVYVPMAALDGIVLGLTMAAVDWLATRRRPPVTAAP